MKQRYYTLKKILGLKALYNIIYGERGNGKTTAVILHGIDKHFTDKSEMAIIRRWEIDFQAKRGQGMFDSDVIREHVVKGSKGEWTDVFFRSMRWYFCRYDEDGNRVLSERPFCYAFSLNSMQHDKSTNYPYIKTILFDEFLEKGGKYLVDEFQLFTNTLSTIIRDKEDVTIFMCANTVSRFAPYWREMGIKADKQKQGTIDIYQYGQSTCTVAVEYCAATDSSLKGSNKYFAFDNPKLKMITEGAWELDIYPHLTIKYRPADVMYQFFIKFNGEIYHCEIINHDTGNFIYVHQKTSEIKDEDNDLIYSLEYDTRCNWIRKINKPVNTLSKRIWELFCADKVCYQDNFVGDSINNYINQCISKK